MGYHQALQDIIEDQVKDFGFNAHTTPGSLVFFFFLKLLWLLIP